MVSTTSAANDSSPPLPRWLKQQGDEAATLVARSEQRDVPRLGHSSHHVPLSSLLQGDLSAGLDLENHIGGFNVGALASNGLSLNSTAHQGAGPISQQQISQDVLNLYGLLTRMSLPQGQARARIPSTGIVQDQASFLHGEDRGYGHNAGNSGCPQQLSFDQQYILPHDGHRDMRGSGSDPRGAVDPLLSFVTRGQDAMYLPLTTTNQAPQYANECGTYGLGQHAAGAPCGRFDGMLPHFQQAGMSEHQHFAAAGAAASQIAQQQLQKAPPKHPLRALSAYNFFFRDERDRIVNETEGDYDTSAEKKRELLERHWYRDRTTKRRHRKTHGKIAFTELSKVISQRWKSLPEHVKSFYHDVAAEDSMRYNREVDAQKSLHF